MKYPGCSWRKQTRHAHAQSALPAQDTGRIIRDYHGATKYAMTKTTSKPTFVALPSKGGDEHFNLSRSNWLDLEKRGLIRLVRLKKPGCIRGRVLIPYTDAEAALRKLGGLS
jgi:hypothetical protein